MFDPELPFSEDSIGRLIAAQDLPQPSTEVVALSKFGCWGFARLSSTLSIDGRPRLIGRELESIRLLHAIDGVLRENRAMTITIAGAPGSGKTRLIEETMAVAAATGFEGRIFSVAAQAGDDANATIARLLLARFGLERVAPFLRREYLVHRVSDMFDDNRVEDVCYFLGRLIGVELASTPLTRALSQHAFHAEVTLQSLVCELFAADSERAPLCLVVEDLHYLDRESLGTLMALTDDLHPGSLVICSARPDFFARNEHFGQMGSAEHEHIDLGALEPDDVRVLVKQLVGPCHNAEADLEQFMLEAALGNPGLVHELVRELWAEGALQAADDDAGCFFHRDRVLDKEPTSSPESDERRLVSLPVVLLAMMESAALVGSVCWRGLWPSLLRVGYPELTIDPRSLDQALAALERGGHLLSLPDSSIDGEDELLFKDPGARERLLEQMPNSRRRALHRAIADWLSAKEKALASSSQLCGLTGRHLVLSGSGFRAAHLYLQAASIARHAENDNLQAASYFRQGLDALGEHDNRRRIDALHDFGVVLCELGRPAQARHAFSEMLALAERLELPNKQGAALNRLGRLHRDSGDLLLAQAMLERALTVFGIARDTRGISATKDDLGCVLWLRGDKGRALTMLRAALEERKEAGDRRSVAVSLAHLARVWHEQGSSVRSEHALSIANDIFEQNDDSRGRCDTALAIGQVATERRDLPRALQCFQAAAQHAYQAKDRPRMARSLIRLGIAKLRMKDLDGAEALLKRSNTLAEQIEAWPDLLEGKRALARIALKRGLVAEARAHVCAALRLSRRVRSAAQLSATFRTLAEVVAAGLPSGATEDRTTRYYVRSIELAKGTGNDIELAKSYRAFASYAERYQSPEILAQSGMLRSLSEEIFRRYAPKSAA